MKTKLLVIVAFSMLLFSCGKDNSTKKDSGSTTAPKTENTTTQKTENNSSEGITYSYDVVNNTGITLVDVFVTPAETNNWGKDILPNDLFEAGSTIRVTIPPDYGETCMFDMKITDTQGGSITFTNIDICKITKLQINADGTFEYLITK